MIFSVFSQFQAGVFDFGHDLRRVSGRPVGFDANLAGQIVNLHNAQGELFGNDLQFVHSYILLESFWPIHRFTGQQFGQNFVTVGGNNWVDATSPITVNNAFGASQSAFVGGNVFTAPVPPSPFPSFTAPSQTTGQVVPPPVDLAPGVSNVTEPLRR
jgi:hypothetical protein